MVRALELLEEKEAGGADDEATRPGLLGGKEIEVKPRESAYGELALRSPARRSRVALDWSPDQPVALTRHVRRLTAPNPGMMTGPGTNSYLVGDAASGFIVIDPGPALPEHIDRLLSACEGKVNVIICTHSHADHSPGAALLKARCAVPPTVWGLASRPTSRPQAVFTPDRELTDGQTFTLIGEGGVTLTLQAIFTPGHAANHTCLLLVEDGLLFSGDHILNGSTTVIDPPDGNMNDYLESLDRLDANCERHGVEFIFPAHGYVLGFARRAIAELKAHRLKREAKILSAMRQQPAGSIEDWIPVAYDDTPTRLWPMAARSLLAHVERIRALKLDRV